MAARILSLALLASGCRAHYPYATLINNGVASKEWEFVREVKPQWAEHSSQKHRHVGWPFLDVESRNFTCNRDAFSSAYKTKTAIMQAGSQIGFRATFDEDDEFQAIFHPGPAQLYIAASPTDDLTKWEGVDGEWVKIATTQVGSWEVYSPGVDYPDQGRWVLPEDESLWPKEVNFTLPATIPPGKYLMRIEQFWPLDTTWQTQFYFGCAHVEIQGPGGGSFEGYPFANFPGTYTRESVTNFFRSVYQWPGPPVWEG